MGKQTTQKTENTGKKNLSQGTPALKAPLLAIKQPRSKEERRKEQTFAHFFEVHPLIIHLSKMLEKKKEIVCEERPPPSALAHGQSPLLYYSPIHIQVHTTYHGHTHIQIFPAVVWPLGVV